MPRPNRPRGVYAEEHLAQWVQREREARGWTYEGLAKRMTDAGCPMNQSAIYKIEQAKPRRRIVVDELVAFAQVFGEPIEVLLAAPELARRRELVRALDDLASQFDQYEELGRRVSELQNEIEHLIGDDVELLKVVLSHRFMASWPAELQKGFLRSIGWANDEWPDDAMEDSQDG